MTARRAAAVAAALVLAAIAPAGAQTVSGTAFEDRDGDGIHDPGEPAVPGVVVRVWGRTSGSAAIDTTVASGADGSWIVTPGTGCYVVGATDPAGWRLAPTRWDRYPDSTPGYMHPVGLPRFSKLDHGIDNLAAGNVLYASMGDSIAWNWNSCFFSGSFWYSQQVRSRLQCTAPTATITLDTAAVKGEHTDDLLVDDTASDDNNVFRALENQPKIVTISAIGNDLLGVDVGNPTQTQVNRAVDEVLDSRQNLQEVLSWLVSGIPDADVSINSLYDNLAWDCYAGTHTTPFHRDWLPIIDRILRDLAWGQTRRVGVNEVAAEFGLEGLDQSCTGFDGQICRDIFQTDQIHPNNTGYQIVREKVWEAFGGVNLGTADAIGRASIGGVDHGYLRRVRRLAPTTWEARGGADVTGAEGALDGDGGGAASVRLGLGTEEFRVGGFPDWYDEIRIVRAVAGVRYRTTGTFGDDLYRIEAAPTGQFRAPAGYAYTTTNWNFYTPLVGGGGPNAPVSNADYPDEALLVHPSVASWRDVSSTLTKNPVHDPGTADYSWPAIDDTDLATTSMRLVAAPVGGAAGPDGRVEIDSMWIDLYGWERPRPAEVTGLRVSRAADGSLDVSWDGVPGAARSNVYFGRLDTVRGGAYDHGASGAPAGPLCDVATTDLGGGRYGATVGVPQQPGGDAYVLATEHVDDVESPAGYSSAAVEIDRSQSSCR